MDASQSMNKAFSIKFASFFQRVRSIRSCSTVILLGLLFYPVGYGYAGTYVVSPSGNDTANGSFGAPFLSVSKAIAVAQPGDSIQLRAGTYRETIAPVRSGTATNPITIESYNGETAIISACDLVPGPWTAGTNNIYSSPVSGSLPVLFWNPPATSAGGSKFAEFGGNLLGTLFNESGSTTRSMTSINPSASWNFFTQAVTWKVRGLNITTTGLPPANAYLWFSIFSPQTSLGAVATSAYAANDGITVRFDGNGQISLYAKKDTDSNLGTLIKSTSSGTINGFDLTLGPSSGTNVPYTFVIKKVSGGDVTYTGNWAVTQAEWSDGGDGSTSHLQIFAQENSSGVDTTQKFTFTVGSYGVYAGATTILRDEFSENDLATVNEFPSAFQSSLVTSGYDQVFVDGVMQHEARTPNFGTGDLLHPATASVTVASASATNNPNTITSSSFNGKTADFYKNARFFGAVGVAWAWQGAVVSGSSGSVLTVNPSTKTSLWWPDYDGTANLSDTGQGFVYGTLNLLDADGEWYLNPATSTLSLRISGGGSPSGHTVEMKRRSWCISINDYDYIIVRGIQTRGGAILLEGTGNQLVNCDARYLSHFLTFKSGFDRYGDQTAGGGVVLGGSNCTVQNCTISDTAGPAIYSEGSDHRILRNTISRSDYAGTFGGAVNLEGEREIVAFNTISDAGRDVVRLAGTGESVMFNDLSGSGVNCDDVGILYSSWTDSMNSTSGKGSRIAYNWVHDGTPTASHNMGIYLDNGSQNFQVDHNVVWNLGSTGTAVSTNGIRLNSPADGHTVYHNTLFNCDTYNGSTYSNFNPATTPSKYPYWTSTNHHLFYTAQNNLVLTDAGASLENPASKDFRPKVGTPAVDPPPATNTATFTATKAGRYLNNAFTYNCDSITAFTYLETLGNGLALAPVNSWVTDGKPDNGAYERGIASWTAGVTGWDGIKMNSPVVGVRSVTLQGLRIATVLRPTQVRLYYGTSDGGTVATAWPNTRDLGTSTPADVLTSYRLSLTGLSGGQIYSARLRATDANGDTWSDVQSFTTYQSYEGYQTKFGLSVSASPATQDSDGDGSPDLLEYAFETNPTSATDFYFPRITSGPAGSSPYLEFTYRINLSATDLTYTLQSSTDLVSWNQVVSDPANVTQTSISGTNLQEIKVKVPTITNPSRLFLRIQVTKQ